MALKECLLNELKQKEDGSGVTDYDESLYTNIKFFWDLFSTGRLTSTVTCTTCGNISTTEVPFDELLQLDLHKRRLAYDFSSYVGRTELGI